MSEQPWGHGNEEGERAVCGRGMGERREGARRGMKGGGGVGRGMRGWEKDGRRMREGWERDMGGRARAIGGGKV